MTERLANFPADTLAGAIALEAKPGGLLAAVEVLDGVVQDFLRILARFARQRVVELVRPAHFLGGVQDAFLAAGGLRKLLDHMAAPR